MNDTSASLRRKISRAGELQSVVRTMKAVAAASIGRYEESVLALADYSRTVELGLSRCLRANGSVPLIPQRNRVSVSGAVIFGSDQGLVGRFNDLVAEHALTTLASLSTTPKVWAVGGRVYARLMDAGLTPCGRFAVPNGVEAISPLVGQLLVEWGTRSDLTEGSELYIFYNRPRSGSEYSPTSQRLLPMDERWQRNLTERRWPTKNLPEVMNLGASTMRTLIREYLFVSIFRACAESSASENASRLAAMERADKNIGELLQELTGVFRRLRQRRIDEELFDVISGFESQELR